MMTKDEGSLKLENRYSIFKSEKYLVQDERLLFLWDKEIQQVFIKFSALAGVPSCRVFP